MVLKPDLYTDGNVYMFYSSVILNGTETRFNDARIYDAFYSSVILNGTETYITKDMPKFGFYSSVILNGTETL